MYQDSKRLCTAIVLLIKPFVWCLSGCRRRRGLLKLPSSLEEEDLWPRSLQGEKGIDDGEMLGLPVTDTNTGRVGHTSVSPV